jgi:hypothetical protein
MVENVYSASCKRFRRRVTVKMTKTTTASKNTMINRRNIVGGVVRKGREIARPLNTTTNVAPNIHKTLRAL